MTRPPSRAAGRGRGPRRVVITGGPAAGKTAVADFLRARCGDGLVVLPESATLLFEGGLPRARTDAGLRALQRAIFAVQRGVEDLLAAERPGVAALCDRGTLDGAVYWPGGPAAFLRALGTSLRAEYARYDAVVFLETAAARGGRLPRNPIRTESAREALRLDRALRRVWAGHPRFHFVPCARSLEEKTAACLAVLARRTALGGRVLSAAAARTARPRARR